MEDQLNWLVRKAHFSLDYRGSARILDSGKSNCSMSPLSILGPFSKEEIIQMVLQKRLEADDEVCLSGAYWFAMHEVAEVKRFLDIDPPKSRVKAHNEEVTQPDFNSESTQPDLSIEQTPTPPMIVRPPVTTPMPPLPNPDAELVESRSYRIEKSQLFGALVMVCFAAMVIGVVWLIRQLSIR